MNLRKRIAQLSLVMVIAVTAPGCALDFIAGLFAGFGGAPAAVQPALGGEETQILYARGLRRTLPEELKRLKIKPDERVWVVNKVSGSNNDSTIDSLTYDAIVDVLRNSAISEVVERDDDLLRGLYVEYTESGTLEARDRALAEQGRIKNADVVLAYRVVRLNVRNPGYIIIAFRYCVAFCSALVGDAQVHSTDGLRMGVHIDVIDAKTGTVRTTALVEHTEPQPSSLVQDEAFSDIPY